MINDPRTTKDLRESSTWKLPSLEKIFEKGMRSEKRQIQVSFTSNGSLYADLHLYYRRHEKVTTKSKL